jgi:hypothetical protein
MNVDAISRITAPLIHPRSPVEAECGCCGFLFPIVSLIPDGLERICPDCADERQAEKDDREEVDELRSVYA